MSLLESVRISGVEPYRDKGIQRIKGCKGRKPGTKNPAQVAGFSGVESLVETFSYCYMVPRGRPKLFNNLGRFVGVSTSPIHVTIQDGLRYGVLLQILPRADGGAKGIVLTQRACCLPLI